MASLNKPSLLVLGGTGFVGKNIIKKGVAKGWQVTSASLSSPVKKNRIKGVKYYKIDLKNFLSVKKKLNKPYNYVINLSGYVNHDSFFSKDNNIIESHFVALKNKWYSHHFLKKL